MKFKDSPPHRLRSTLRIIGNVLRETTREWKRDNVPESAAALAFYTTISLAPLLLILIALAGIYLEPRVAQGRVFDQLTEIVGQEGARFVRGLLHDAHERTAAATLFSTATILVGAAVVFGELQTVLNRIWGVTPDRSMRAFGKKRLLAFVMVLGAGLLLFLFLTAGTVVSALDDFLGTLPVSPPPYVLESTGVVVSFLVTTLLFALVYKVLPDTVVEWRAILVGAATTSVLFTLGKELMELYVGSGIIRSTYGAASSLVVLLMWIFYSSHVCLFGAELTKVLDRRIRAGWSWRNGRPAGPAL